MAISVVEPVGDAFQSIGRVCFRPFQVGKWFVMGFCAFLAGCVEGGVNVPGCQMRSMGAEPSDQDVQEAVRWMEAHLALVVAVAAAVLVLMIALGVLHPLRGNACAAAAGTRLQPRLPAPFPGAVRPRLAILPAAGGVPSRAPG